MGTRPLDRDDDHRGHKNITSLIKINMICELRERLVGKEEQGQDGEECLSQKEASF